VKFVLNKNQTESLQLAANNSFMKIFNTKSKNVVIGCLKKMFYVFESYIVKPKHKFLAKFINSRKYLCHLFYNCREKI